MISLRICPIVDIPQKNPIFNSIFFKEGGREVTHPCSYQSIFLEKDLPVNSMNPEMAELKTVICQLNYLSNKSKFLILSYCLFYFSFKLQFWKCTFLLHFLLYVHTWLTINILLNIFNLRRCLKHPKYGIYYYRNQKLCLILSFVRINLASLMAFLFPIVSYILA